ncbi:MAG TPA: hypothetical protein VFQ53_27775 [Kofleriaceae bacterium]|nr:hypothetical protein [Kofleriaceae bacterium]
MGVVIVVIVLIVGCGSKDESASRSSEPAAVPKAPLADAGPRKASDASSAEPQPPAGRISDEEVRTIIGANKEAIVSEMIRNAKPAQRVERIWDASCEDVRVFTLAQGCLPLVYARVRVFTGRLYLVLGPKQAPTCAANMGPQVEHVQPVVVVSLPRGAGTAGFAGRPLAATAEIVLSEKAYDSVSGGSSRVTLEPGELHAGERVRGELAIDGIGKGRFSAEVCPGDYSALVAPPMAPAKQLVVTIGGRPFRPVSTVAHVWERDRTTVYAVVMFDHKADCTTPRDRDALNIAGDGTHALLLDTVQPAHAAFPSLALKAILEADGWGDWQGVQGGVLRGRVHLSSPPGTDKERMLTVSGPISAKVCKR